MLAWFISKQFSDNRRLFYRIMAQHNKEDDDRLEMLKDDIWAIRIRNAQKDGDVPPEYNTFPRRGYMVEERR